MANNTQVNESFGSTFSAQLVALLGALAAAIVPATEAVKGWWGRELKVTELNHKITQDFIARALSEKGDLDEQLRVLSILASIKDNPLASWATAEQKKVSNLLHVRREEIENFRKIAKAADKASIECEDAIENLREVAGQKAELRNR